MLKIVPKTTFFHSQSHASTHKNIHTHTSTTFQIEMTQFRTTEKRLFVIYHRLVIVDCAKKRKKKENLKIQCLYVCAQFVELLIRETPFPTKSTFVCTHRFFFSFLPSLSFVTLFSVFFFFLDAFVYSTIYARCQCVIFAILIVCCKLHSHKMSSMFIEL